MFLPITIRITSAYVNYPVISYMIKRFIVLLSSSFCRNISRNIAPVDKLSLNVLCVLV
jgi:hypothetical protein